MPRYTVEVPIRTTQTFVVEAASPVGAKRKVQHWYTGARDEGSDLEVGDDLGAVCHRQGTATWKVTPAT